MNVTVYCGSSRGNNPHFADAARDLGNWIASNGHSLVYGGSSIGLMGIIAGEVLRCGGCAIGVEPRFFIDAGVEQHDLTELIVVETMAERKQIMIELGDAFVAMPGGFGTLEEISEIMSRLRLKFGNDPCIFLNIDGYYDPLKTMVDQMFSCGFIEEPELEGVSFPTSVAQAARIIESRR